MPEAPVVGGIGHINIADPGGPQLFADGVEAHGIDAGLGFGIDSGIFAEGIFERAIAYAGYGAELRDSGWFFRKFENVLVDPADDFLPE